jgi:lipopolysaccharide biosynthesis glycosyltransferase
LTTTYPNHTNIDHPHNDHDDRIEGMLYSNVTKYEIQRLDAFEDIEYTKEPCLVNLHQTGTVESPQVYMWTSSLECLNMTQSWSYLYFCRYNLNEYLQNCRRRIIPNTLQS